MQFQEQGSERAVGSSPAGKAANAFLLALSRAARSFLLYDPGNEAIAGFLQDLRDRATDFAREHGALELAVQPFELLLEGEVVYLERDRERSLAFRMFRDGVRVLRLEKKTDWDELLRLLEILSIRFTGVRQQEDDLVTLLWKAGFKSIEIQAVEGVLPEEEEELDDSIDESETHTLPPPRDRDQPLPDHGQPAPVAWSEQDEDLLGALRDELTSTRLPQACMALIDEVTRLIEDPADPMTVSDARHLLGEVRDFLLAEQQLSRAIDLAWRIDSLRDRDPLVVGRLMAGFVDPRALVRMVESVQGTHDHPPPELVELLETLPGDHLSTLIALLERDRNPGPRRIARQLIEVLTPGREDQVMAHVLGTEDPGVAADLLRAAGRVLPNKALEVGRELAGRGPAELTSEVLWFLSSQEASGDISELLLDLLRNAPTSELRAKALEAIGRLGHEPTLDAVAAWGDRHGRSLSPTEAEALGQSMARINGRLARRHFEQWIRPPGLLSRFIAPKGVKMLQWAGAAGLELVEGEADDELLEWLGKRAAEDLGQRCKASLVRRRRKRRGD